MKRRTLTAIREFTLGNYKVIPEAILDFGKFPDSIFYDLQLDNHIEKKGVITLSVKFKDGAGVTVPIAVENKYSLFEELKDNGSCIEKQILDESKSN